MNLTEVSYMDNQEVIKRLQDHFRVHNDGRPTPYLDEAVEIMFNSLENYNAIIDKYGSFEKVMSTPINELRDGVTVDDVYNTGFDAEIHWAFYFLRKIINDHMTDDELIRLASWFELKQPHNDMGEWYSIMKHAIE